jgi:hypothetical protein
MAKLLFDAVTHAAATTAVTATAAAVDDDAR